MPILIKNPRKDRDELSRQAALITLSLLYSTGLAKFQYFMDGQERYAKYVVENARLLGFRPPKKLDKNTIELMQSSAKAIARLQNQAFQIFNHHENALEIFPKVLQDTQNAGLDIVWDLDTPERLKDIVFANREKFGLDNWDYPRQKKDFACNLSDKLYQDTEHSLLHEFCKKAGDSKVHKFVFYPQFKSFFESPPPEKQPRRSLFKKAPSEAPLVGGNGKSVGIKDQMTLMHQFRQRTIVVGYKYR